MKRKRWVSGCRLAQAGLLGHFKRNRHVINMDAVYLDQLQFKRFLRAENATVTPHP